MLRNVTNKHTYLLKKYGTPGYKLMDYRIQCIEKRSTGVGCVVGAVMSSYIGFKLFIANILDAS